MLDTHASLFAVGGVLSQLQNDREVVIAYASRTYHSTLRWLQRFRNGDGMRARWYLLLGQFSVTFEYRPGAQ